MKLLSALILILILILTACNQTEVQKADEAAKIVEASTKYAYDCQCAQAICDKKMDIKGNNEITYEKNGVIYCFESVEAKSKFLQEIDDNITRANSHWFERLGNKGI